MKVVDLPPVASTLLEAMRAVGYSFETAMADIIDNSVTAGANEVDVFFSPYGEPYVSVIDNGEGMNSAQLRVAMRHGSRNPLVERPVGVDGGVVSGVGVTAVVVFESAPRLPAASTARTW